MEETLSERITASGVSETLERRFSRQSTLRKTSESIFRFPSDMSAPESELSLMAGLELILNTARATISKITTILGATRNPEHPGDHGFKSAHEQFNTLFFLACTRAYLQALSEQAADLLQEAQGKPLPEAPESNLNAVLLEVQQRIAAIDEAELNYLFTAEPLHNEVPLFNAYNEWLTAALVRLGYPGYTARGIADKCNMEARTIFRGDLAASDPDAEWMRNFLAIAAHTETAHVANDLRSIRQTLESWTDTGRAKAKAREKAWVDYRDTMINLPDASDTMFNEAFGVSRVFQSPVVQYYVNGMLGDAGTPHDVSDIGHLLGALVSNRTEGQALVVLAGGPGSGKSTLCKVFASELAGVDGLHPIFLRLRRAREGEDIAQFIEDQLRRLGLIDKIADLIKVPNVVLVLDGFDELVMASRSRLRQFFNVLVDDIANGPLRRAKVVVSGRDTLFPGGRGLPSGSHVLSLLPFDRSRVTAWGKLWRDEHSDGPGKTFHPEKLLSDGKTGSNKPLHHLVSWPLTLHLVARIHTAGHLGIKPDDENELDKAYLYRSILAETATRQVGQTAGEGRLDADKMRAFLRTLAWEMFRRSVDSLDVGDAVPLLARYYPSPREGDPGQLAEIAVVNAPELTRGEETGFEFVHKSFAEFLVAEVVAEQVERVCFKVPEFGSDDVAWRMSSEEAASALAGVIGLRVMPPEVQEMFEPMIGGLLAFQKGTKVDERVPIATREEGLVRTMERLECLYEEALNGNPLPTVLDATRNVPVVTNPLEAYANYCLGLTLIGSASSRQLLSLGAHTVSRRFQVEPFEGALWRFLAIAQAGGLVPDEQLASRLFDGLTVNGPERRQLVDLDTPLKLRLLGAIDGFELRIPAAVESLIAFGPVQSYVSSVLSEMPRGQAFQLERERANSPGHPNEPPPPAQEEAYAIRRRLDQAFYYALREVIGELVRFGAVDHSATRVADEFGRLQEYVAGGELHRFSRSPYRTVDPREYLERLFFILGGKGPPGLFGEIQYLIGHLVDWVGRDDQVVFR